MINEDDDFVDMDKDDLSTVTGFSGLQKAPKSKLESQEKLPMPILASGFDFDDYVPDFKKSRDWWNKVGWGAGGKDISPREIRYTSKRYGGMGSGIAYYPTNN